MNKRRMFRILSGIAVGLVTVVLLILAASLAINASRLGLAVARAPAPGQAASSSQAPPPANTETPVAVGTTPAFAPKPQAGWQTYRGPAYTMQYPDGYTLLENQIVSADGVKSPANGTLTLLSPALPAAKANFKLTVEQIPPGRYVSIEQAVDQNEWCAALSMQKAQSTSVGGKAAYLFQDLPCGPFGTTAIYVADGQEMYLIKIESAAPYETIKPTVDELLSTLSFVG